MHIMCVIMVECSRKNYSSKSSPKPIVTNKTKIFKKPIEVKHRNLLSKHKSNACKKNTIFRCVTIFYYYYSLYTTTYNVFKIMFILNLNSYSNK